MNLDHATIVTKDLEAVRRFFCDVAGLSEGPRPPFGVDGYWLYAGGRAVIHLIGDASAMREGMHSPRIDHIAFRIETATEWAALLARMASHNVRHQLADVPAARERQLFAALAPGVVIEFVTALRPAAHTAP